MKVIYHANCVDGFTAAWLLGKIYPTAEFIPLRYGQDVEDFDIDRVRDESVIMVDFSFPRDLMLEVFEKSKYLKVFDHHGSAESVVRDFGTYDVNKCGARLVYEDPVFKADLLARVGNRAYLGMETLIDYVEDRDLWKWEEPDSREVNAVIGSYEFTNENWDRLAVRLDTALHEVVCEGQAILRAQRRVIDFRKSKAWQMEIASYRVPVVNSTVHVSEIARELSEGYPFAACFFVEGDTLVFSLRSSEGGLDVSEIAKQYGGGGHARAAGFNMDIEGFNMDIEGLFDICKPVEGI